MRRLAITYSFFLLAMALFGCSRAIEEPAAPQPTPEPTVAAAIPIAEITDANAALAEGNRLFDENQTQAAIDAYRHAITLDPGLADAHFQLGIAYALLAMQNEQAGVVTQPQPPANSKREPPKTDSEKAFEAAVKAYEKRIDKSGDDDAAYFNLGRTYVKLLQDEDAEKAFKQAVKLKPEDAEYQTELGAILIILAQYAEAIGPLKKAVELDPGNARAHELLEDAQAGRQRIDYRQKNTNQSQAANRGVKSKSNTNTNSPSNSNNAVKPPAGNTKPPVPSVNRPKLGNRP
jgi:tetratricopeptide (TPR) repeat protein